MNWRILPLIPLLALQALWVVLRAQRLPEAAGPRSGTTGDGPKLRLLIIGDSSAAGVGVSQQSDAMAGQIALHLSDTHRVHWQLKARTGATTRDALKWLKAMNPATYDVALIVFGVNDSKNGMPRQEWQSNLRDLVHLLRTAYSVKHVFIPGLPPMGKFPLLPNPLRRVLGQRADDFDRALVDVVSTEPNVHIVRLDLPEDPNLMASDGFHPGAEVYREMGKAVATAIRAALPRG